MKERVSVLIPTLNAGEDFRTTLRTLREQEGIGELEILVADSGSTDGTVELAEEHGARVFRVPPQEFNHGRTRDWLAERSGGDVLLLTVQDAYLPRRDAVRRLVSDLLRHPRRAAVSARQRPRPDSDLYGGYWIWNHNRGTRAARAANPNARFPDVDNVCAALRRVAWQQVRFREIDYAEDLDFGKRALDLGWDVHLSDDVEVVHSHDRSAVEQLRRNIDDRLYGAPLVGDVTVSEAARKGVASAVGAGRGTFERLSGAIRSVSRSADDYVDLADYVEDVATSLGRASGNGTPAPPLAELLGKLPVEDEDPVLTSALTAELAVLLRSESLREFVQAHRRTDQNKATDFVVKVAAALVGRVIGDALRTAPADPALATQLTGKLTRV